MSCSKENRDIKDIVRYALAEDIGRGDITTELFVPENKTAEAVLLAKENFVVCGLSLASLVFKTYDKTIKFEPLTRDGDWVKRGMILARIRGRARGILTCERVMLNFLSLLSGIATQTKKFVEAVKPYKVKILDTRKTIPGLRLLSKYAVRIGGGFNHRLSLDEMIMVKDNHLKVLGGYRRFPPVKKRHKTEVEVKNLKEFKGALKLKPDIIMLDNMKITDIKETVKIRNKFSSHPSNPVPKLEASGGITLKNVKQIAATGVDMISVGGLTHSVDSANISLEVLRVL